MASISRALARIKEDLRPFLPDESIEAACRQAGHGWRARVLGPVQTLHLFILQVLHFNTAISGLRHLAKFAFSEGSYCDARSRLPLAALQSLLRSSSAALREAARRARRADADADAAGYLWRGLRALLVDGSSTIAPDTPALDKAFGHPTGQKPGCGFPVPKVLGLFDALTGLVVEMLCFPLFTHDMGKVCQLHPLLSAGDLLVGDRGFCSFAHLALLHLRAVAGLFRMHQRQIVDFRPHRRHGGKGRPKSRFVKRLGKWDQVVDWLKPKSLPGWMTKQQYAALPASVRVREIRYRIPRKGQRTLCVTIATTLLDPVLYPKDEIARLYNLRWVVETHFAELKTTLRMRRVKCRTEDGVRKELAVYCLVYNLVHAVMLEAARRQRVTPDRISFLDAARWLQNAEPGEELPDLVVNPRRPDRHEPRVIKDLQDTYRKMTKPRSELRKALRKIKQGEKVRA
jgi:hypothetical protein